MVFLGERLQSGLGAAERSGHTAQRLRHRFSLWQERLAKSLSSSLSPLSIIAPRALFILCLLGEAPEGLRTGEDFHASLWGRGHGS